MALHIRKLLVHNDSVSVPSFLARWCSNLSCTQFWQLPCLLNFGKLRRRNCCKRRGPLSDCSKVPEGYHSRGTTLREALRGVLRGLCGGSLPAFCGALQGNFGVAKAVFPERCGCGETELVKEQC